MCVTEVKEGFDMPAVVLYSWPNSNKKAKSGENQILQAK